MIFKRNNWKICEMCIYNQCVSNNAPCYKCKRNDLLIQSEKSKEENQRELEKREWLYKDMPRLI